MDAERLVTEMAWVRGLGARAAARCRRCRRYRARGVARRARPRADRSAAAAVAAPRRRQSRADAAARCRTKLGARRGERGVGAAADGGAVDRARRDAARGRGRSARAGRAVSLDDLLHYVEGLTSAEIARRLGIPDATVRRRLSRALDEIRARLRARDERGWLAALVPLVRTPAFGALTMKKLIAAAIALVLALLIGAGVKHVISTRRPGDAAASSSRSALSAMRGMRGARPDDPLHRLDGLPAWLVAPNIAPRKLAGRVIFQGKPVAGAVVRLGIDVEHPQMHVDAMTGGPQLTRIAELRTTAAGTFDFGLLPAATFVVSAEADGQGARVGRRRARRSARQYRPCRARARRLQRAHGRLRPRQCWTCREGASADRRTVGHGLRRDRPLRDVHDLPAVGARARRGRRLRHDRRQFLFDVRRAPPRLRARPRSGARRQRRRRRQPAHRRGGRDGRAADVGRHARGRDGDGDGRRGRPLPARRRRARAIQADRTRRSTCDEGAARHRRDIDDHDREI